MNDSMKDLIRLGMSRKISETARKAVSNLEHGEEPFVILDGIQEALDDMRKVIKESWYAEGDTEFPNLQNEVQGQDC